MHKKSNKEDKEAYLRLINKRAINPFFKNFHEVINIFDKETKFIGDLKDCKEFCKRKKIKLTF